MLLHHNLNFRNLFVLECRLCRWRFFVGRRWIEHNLLRLLGLLLTNLFAVSLPRFGLEMHIAYLEMQITKYKNVTVDAIYRTPN
jgi:hypothetical protein